jgi:hypothetical protein
MTVEPKGANLTPTSYSTRINRRRRLISEPASISLTQDYLAEDQQTSSPGIATSTAGPIRRQIKVVNTSSLLTNNNNAIKRPTAILIRRSPGSVISIQNTLSPASSSTPKTIKITTLDGSTIRRPVKIYSNVEAHSLVGSLDSGLVLTESEGSSSNSKKSSPTGSKRSSPISNVTSATKYTLLQSLNHANSGGEFGRSPPVESPPDRNRALFGSVSPGSYNAREVRNFGTSVD